MAVCSKLNCDYQYVEPVGEVTAFTYDSETRQLIVEGTDLPQADENLRFIYFAKTRCELTSTPYSSVEYAVTEE